MTTLSPLAKDLHEMSIDDITKLLSIRLPKDFNTVEVIDTYRDDHIACAVAKLNGIAIDWPWCGDEVIAALLYGNTKRGKKRLSEQYFNWIEMALDDMFSQDDDYIKANITKYQQVIAFAKSLQSDDEVRVLVETLLNNFETSQLQF